MCCKSVTIFIVKTVGCVVWLRTWNHFMVYFQLETYEKVKASKYKGFQILATVRLGQSTSAG